MVDREIILGELQRMSMLLGRTPGRVLFAKRTGIQEKDWLGIHWARWGDVVREAGLEANVLQARSDSEALLNQLYKIAGEFGRMPTEAEQKIYARQNPGFPNRNTFRAILGDKAQMTTALRKWLLTSKPDDPLIPYLSIECKPKVSTRGEKSTKDGWVYLLRSGEFFKIGRSDELERRVKQVATAMPDKVHLEHAIRTDDPVGIEAYWHRRFADRRANGEWFKLSPADLKAFKLRKFQ